MAKATAVVSITRAAGPGREGLRDRRWTASTSSTKRAAGPRRGRWSACVIHGAAGDVRLDFASFIHARR